MPYFTKRTNSVCNVLSSRYMERAGQSYINPSMSRHASRGPMDLPEKQFDRRNCSRFSDCISTFWNLRLRSEQMRIISHTFCAFSDSRNLRMSTTPGCWLWLGSLKRMFEKIVTRRINAVDMTCGQKCYPASK